jgi:HEAT repeat protein
MSWIISVLAMSLFAGHPSAHAQAPTRTPLDPAAIDVVDPLYPGFTEILERDDAAGLVKLARTLSNHPSPESLAVLLWMLRYCPSWPNDGVLQIDKTIRSVGRLPLAPVAGALLHATADQRLTAAALLANHGRLIPDSEKPLLDKTLVAALADRNDRVRDMVVAALRARGSAEADRAVREYLAKRDATLPTRRQSQLDATRFPPATTALLDSLDPDYHKTLTTLNEAAVRRLLDALQRSRNPAGTPVLMWLLANGDTRAYGGNIVYQLSLQEHAMRLPFGELAGMLRRAEPDRKALIAELFAKVFATRTQAMSPAERGRIIAALIECLDIPHGRLRAQAIEALGNVGAAQAVGPIVLLLNQQDGDRYQMMTQIQALAAIGTREAVLTLERLARSGPSQAVREAAVAAYIRVTKLADPGAHVRRLLWEQPDTALEKRVLVEGKAALPAVWQALAGRSADDRRAAAALLGWFRDVRSIEPIVTALDTAPGALTREQLLFDLNMILLTEARPVVPGDRNALAALHLQWLYDQLINHPIDSDTRAKVLAQKTIHVLPDRITAPFSATLGATTAILSRSPEAFLDAVRKTGCGVAFHAITAANGVARVATTLYLPKGGIANQVWISLYRRDGNGWAPLPVPSHPVLHRFLNEPSLMPTINRNYGPDHPLKILRLDLTMERIRAGLNAGREYLRDENREDPANYADLDDSYLRLLERHTRSDSPLVKYTAEFESVRLTKQPNLELWIDALSQQSGTPIQGLAIQVLAAYVAPRFKTEGGLLAGTERAELAAGALKPEAVDPRLIPTQLPKPENVRNVRQWSRFGLVDLAFGSEPRGQNGYSMLFERRGNRWVFLCVVSSWMS